MKTHRSQNGEVVVAVCDEELIGKKLRVSTRTTVEVAEVFYKGVLIFDSEMIEYIRKGTIVNIVGEKAVSTAIKYGLAKKESIIYIDGVPHLQLFL